MSSFKFFSLGGFLLRKKCEKCIAFLVPSLQCKLALFRVALSLHSFATLRNWLRQPLQSLPRFVIQILEIEPIIKIKTRQKMTSEKINDLELVNLSDYFDSRLVRLIPADAVATSGGISEIPLTFNIHTEVQKKLNFETKKLQQLYGFTIITKKIKEINESPYYPDKKEGKLRFIELNDCGEVWILKFEFLDDTTKLYAVKSDEVIKLLNNCRKPQKDF